MSKAKIKEKDNFIWSCNESSVRAGWTKCDGDCWHCEHHFLEDLNHPELYEQKDISIEDIIPEGSLQMVMNIYKKTLGYELEKIKVNDDGTTTHLHSDAFLDEHPERRSSPEFTEEEENEQLKFIAAAAKIF